VQDIARLLLNPRFADWRASCGVGEVRLAKLIWRPKAAENRAARNRRDAGLPIRQIHSDSLTVLLFYRTSFRLFLSSFFYQSQAFFWYYLLSSFWSASSLFFRRPLFFVVDLRLRAERRDSSSA